MYKLFERKNLFSYILTLLLFVGILYRLILSSTNWVQFGEETPFLNCLFNITTISRIAIVIIYSLSILSIGVGQNFIFKSLNTFTKNTSLPAFIFFTHCTIFLTFRQTLHDILLLDFAFIILFVLANSIKNNNTSYVFFKIGVLIAIFSLLSSKLLLLIIPLLLSINLFGKKGLKDYIAFIIGALLLIYLVVSILYLTDNSQFFYQYFNSFKLYKYSFMTLPYVFCITLMVSEGVINMGNITTLNINSRKLYSLLFNIGLISLLFTLFFSFKDTKIPILISYIGSFYLTVFISNSNNKKLNNILIILCLLLAIINIFVL